MAKAKRTKDFGSKRHRLIGEAALDVYHAYQMTEERLAKPDEWPDWLIAAAEKPEEEMYAVHGRGGDKLEIQYEKGHVEAVPSDAYIVKGRVEGLWFCDAEAFEAKFERVWVKRKALTNAEVQSEES